MGDSLRDQLLKAGFEPAKAEQKPKRKPGKPGKRGDAPRRAAPAEPAPPAAPAKPEVSAEAPRTVPATAPDEAAPKRKKKKRKGEGSLADKNSPAYQKAMARAARLMQAREGGEGEPAAAEGRPYHFVHGSRVRSLYVTVEQQQALAEGRLAIVAEAAGGYRLAPSEEAEQLQAADPGLFVHRVTEEGDDDPYADYPVPDDLHW